MPSGDEFEIGQEGMKTLRNGVQNFRNGPSWPPLQGFLERRSLGTLLGFGSSSIQMTSSGLILRSLSLICRSWSPSQFGSEAEL